MLSQWGNIYMYQVFSSPENNSEYIYANIWLI